MLEKQTKRAMVMQAVISLRLLLLRLSLLFMVLFCVSVLALGRFGSALPDSFRTNLQDVLVPVMDIIASPARGLASLKITMESYLAVREQNEFLKAENARLSRLESVALVLEAENRRLRSQLKFVPEKGIPYITARIVSTDGSPLSHSAMVNAGAVDGLVKGQVVTADGVLLGRIQDVGDNSARVLLITDIGSFIPVITKDTGERAMLTGTNTEYPDLNHLPGNSKAQVGELVVTSGDGAYFPAGIVVGVIDSTDTVPPRIKPAADFGRISTVAIAGAGRQH